MQRYGSPFWLVVSVATGLCASMVGAVADVDVWSPPLRPGGTEPPAPPLELESSSRRPALYSEYRLPSDFGYRELREVTPEVARDLDRAKLAELYPDSAKAYRHYVRGLALDRLGRSTDALVEYHASLHELDVVGRELGIEIVASYHDHQVTMPWSEYSATAPDLRLLAKRSQTIIEELRKYSKRAFRYAGLVTVYLVGSLRKDGISGFGGVASRTFFYVNIARMPDSVRNTIHHEIMHIVDDGDVDDPVEEWTEWSRHNPAGFAYTGYDADYFYAEAIGPGFFDYNAMRHPLEDRAEIYAEACAAPRKLAMRMLGDDVLASKVRALAVELDTTALGQTGLLEPFLPGSGAFHFWTDEDP